METALLQEVFSKKKIEFRPMEFFFIFLLIGILTFAVFFTYTYSQKRIRDEKRKADLRAIVHALEIKYNEELKYPNIGTFESTIPPDSSVLQPYLEKVPHEFEGVPYYWYTDPRQQKFCVYFKLETNNKYFSCTGNGCKVSEEKCPDF